MIKILDKNFRLQYYIENIKTLSWSEPFIGCGDFELEIPLVEDNYSLFNSLGWYVEKEDSDYTMMINKVNIKDNGVDDIKTIILSGESLESILKRRVVWGTLVTSGDIEDRITKILNYNITCTEKLNPGSTYGYNAYQNDRKINEFDTIYYLSDGRFVYPKKENGEDDTEEIQYTGDNVYDVILNLCLSADIQFRIKRNNKKFSFSLRKKNDNRKTVIVGDFLYDYENIEFYKDNVNYKNASIIGGANDWPDRCYAYFKSDDNAIGLNRYEIFVDARNEKDSEDQQQDVVSLTNTYKNILISKGRDELKKAKLISNFSGNFTKIFKNRILSGEIQNGDILTMYSTKLDMSWPAKLIELSYSYDESGEFLTPTFEYYDE